MAVAVVAKRTGGVTWWQGADCYLQQREGAVLKHHRERRTARSIAAPDQKGCRIVLARANERRDYVCVVYMCGVAPRLQKLADFSRLSRIGSNGHDAPVIDQGHQIGVVTHGQTSQLALQQLQCSGLGRRQCILRHGVTAGRVCAREVRSVTMAP
jgi:hypothetical protein